MDKCKNMCYSENRRNNLTGDPMLNDLSFAINKNLYQLMVDNTQVLTRTMFEFNELIDEAVTKKMVSLGPKSDY